MKTSASLAMLLAVTCLAIGNICDVLSLREKQRQIDALNIRIIDLETVVTKLHETTSSHQLSLEKQGNINTSLINITETLAKGTR